MVRTNNTRLPRSIRAYPRGAVEGAPARQTALLRPQHPVSGGPHDGQPVFSLFSPNNNATGGFVGWEGLDQSGFSEQPAYDVHNGTFTGTLANIELGLPPTETPLPGALPLFAGGLAALGIIRRRSRRRAAAN